MMDVKGLGDATQAGLKLHLDSIHSQSTESLELKPNKCGHKIAVISGLLWVCVSGAAVLPPRWCCYPSMVATNQQALLQGGDPGPGPGPANQSRWPSSFCHLA